MTPFTVDTIPIHLPMFDAAKVRARRQRLQERARQRSASGDKPKPAAPLPASSPKVARARAPESVVAQTAPTNEAKASEHRSELTQLLFPNGL